MGAANSIACGCIGPCAYVFVMCEHGTPMYMHMSVCTHMATHQAPHGIEDVHAYARTYVRRLCAHHSYAQQSIPSDDLCISICYFWIESSKRRNDQQARWPTGKPLLEETLRHAIESNLLPSHGWLADAYRHKDKRM